MCEKSKLQKYKTIFIKFKNKQIKQREARKL